MSTIVEERGSPTKQATSLEKISEDRQTYQEPDNSKPNETTAAGGMTSEDHEGPNSAVQPCHSGAELDTVPDQSSSTLAIQGTYNIIWNNMILQYV